MAKNSDLFTRVDSDAFHAFDRLESLDAEITEAQAREIRNDMITGLRTLGTVPEPDGEATGDEDPDFDLGPFVDFWWSRSIGVVVGNYFTGNALVGAVTETLMKHPPGSLVVSFEHLGAYLSVMRKEDGIAAVLHDSYGHNGIT